MSMHSICIDRSDMAMYRDGPDFSMTPLAYAMNSYSRQLPGSGVSIRSEQLMNTHIMYFKMRFIKDEHNANKCNLTLHLFKNGHSVRLRRIDVTDADAVEAMMRLAVHHCASEQSISTFIDAHTTDGMMALKTGDSFTTPSGKYVVEWKHVQ